jgi:predicted dienelactone hydrolase
MRPFETVTVLLLFAIWSSYLLPEHKRPRWLFVLPILAVVAVIVQLVVEGYRWQMVLTYALAVLLFIGGLLSFLRKAKATTNPIPLRRRIIRIVGMSLGFIVLAIAVALSVELPVFQLPTPTGPYMVGTTTFEFVDQARSEVYPPNTTSHRDLIVQVWYPAEALSGAKPQPYWTDAYGPYFAAALNMPSFAFDYVNSIPSHSYKDAPIANARPTYPVLVFSPGNGSTVNQSTAQMEELASHGYVVFGIEHPYDATVVFYPDGRVVPSSSWQPASLPTVSNEEIIAAHNQCVTTPDPVAAKDCWKHFIALSPTVQNTLQIWTQDTRYVLDELERLNRGELPSVFSGRLDLNRIGLFGHSLGGATAGEVCLLDSRCKAGANMDGFQYGDLLDNPVTQPFMILYSSDGIGGNDFMYNQVENQAYRVFIQGTRHNNFTDASIELGAPVGGILGLVGPIDGQHMETILSHYLVAFFDKHLMGIASPLLDAPDPAYPEVDFQKRSWVNDN